MTSTEWRDRISTMTAELGALEAERAELNSKRPDLALEEDGAGLKKLDARVSAVEHQARNVNDSIERFQQKRVPPSGSVMHQG